MDFEWDEAKSAANLASRGLDFAYARRVFEGRCVEREDRRRSCGESRVIAIGVVDGLHLTVVYTDRVVAEGRTVRRVISARKSSRRERQAYAEIA
jgi:uncharacterized DUF497 family protein